MKLAKIFFTLTMLTGFQALAEEADPVLVDTVHKGQNYQLVIKVVDEGEPIAEPESVSITLKCGAKGNGKTVVLAKSLKVCTYKEYQVSETDKKITIKYLVHSYDEKTATVTCSEEKTRVYSFGDSCK